MERKWLFTFLILIGINLLVLDGWVVWDKQKTSEVTGLVGLESGESDLKDRLGELENKIGEIKNQVEKTREITVTPVGTKVMTQVTTSKSKHVDYVSISGGFGQVAYDWVDVPASEFYFDKLDYNGMREIRFESNMKLFNGNGMAYVRLFDVTHGVAVTGSQVETGNQDNTVVTSGLVNFMNGKNLIRVQIKSLTADSTVFNSGRLVITSEY